MLSPEKLCGRGEASDLMGCHEEGHFIECFLMFQENDKCAKCFRRTVPLSIEMLLFICRAIQEKVSCHGNYWPFNDLRYLKISWVIILSE